MNSQERQLTPLGSGTQRGFRNVLLSGCLGTLIVKPSDDQLVLESWYPIKVGSTRQLNLHTVQIG